MPSDYQFTFNNLTFSPSNALRVVEVEGLSIPEVRQDFITKAAEHGAYPYAQFLETRKIVLTGFVNDSDPQARLNELGHRMAPQPLTQPLAWKVPGDISKRCYVLPGRTEWKYDPLFTKKYVEFVLEFLAGDPRIYDDNQQQVTLTASTAVTNSGTFPTPPLVQITGAATNPRVTLSSTGEYVQALGTVPVGQTLTLDFPERTMRLGTTGRYDMLEAGSVWWNLGTGTNTVTYTGGGTATLSWRSAWI